MNTQLQERWNRLWRQAGPDARPEAVYDELIQLYTQPHRHYHNLHHIAACLAEFDSARSLALQPLALELAIWFHDAIYDTHAPDNEERSAELAKRHLHEARSDEALTGAVNALILATKTHNPSAHPDAPLMVDVDLSILGQPVQRFDEFETEIRREYEWVPLKLFATKRAEILEQFQKRTRIYSTQPFADKYEKQARINLENAIKKLRAAVP